MTKLNIASLMLLGCLFISWSAFAQSKDIGNELSKNKTWQLLDYHRDSVYGASVNRAYDELLKGKKGHQVIVAVIDEGVDIAHTDLRDHIWRNKKEIPENQVDDDNDGYVDDVHGWNFLGGKDGKMIYATNSEADREYARLLPMVGKLNDSSSLTNDKSYQYFLAVREKHLRDSADRRDAGYAAQMNFFNPIASADSILQRLLGKRFIYFNDVESFRPSDSSESKARALLLDLFSEVDPEYKSLSMDSIVKIGVHFVEAERERRLLFDQVRDDPFEQRREIVGDNPFDINDKKYGNNLVGDKYADHGTHCAGVIAAIRNNGMGMDGVADNVVIMPIRAVNTLTYGDEMDKDVALAIRYAVDQGAKVISMSFGKNISPQKLWVDDAVKYAEKRGVLIVHGAGNEGRNIDSAHFYPNADFLNASGRANNLLTVGASSADTGLSIVAKFSNYGQKEVDLFAPGVDIYSTIPENRYEFRSGTSMATPLVAGVAALILEYYPDLTYKQVKHILMASVTSLKGKIVYKPGTKQKVDFGELCVSGGIVNAFRALQLADQMTIKGKLSKSK